MKIARRANNIYCRSLHTRSDRLPVSLWSDWVDQRLPRNEPIAGVYTLHHCPQKRGWEKLFIWRRANPDDQLVYIGESRNIRKRLGNHLSARSGHVGKYVRQYCDEMHVEWTRTHDVADAKLLEARLIREFGDRNPHRMPLLNRQEMTVKKGSRFNFSLFVMISTICVYISVIEARNITG